MSVPRGACAVRPDVRTTAVAAITEGPPRRMTGLILAGVQPRVWQLLPVRGAMPRQGRPEALDGIRPNRGAMPDEQVLQVTLQEAVQPTCEFVAIPGQLSVAVGVPPLIGDAKTANVVA